MNLFSGFMDRMKSQVGLSKDKEIAALLKLSTTALSERKKRDSVPIKEVFALAKDRPELNIDPDWIVTGESKSIEVNSEDETSLMQCYRLMSMQEKFRLREIALLWSGTMALSASPNTMQVSPIYAANDHTERAAAQTNNNPYDQDGNKK